MTTNHAYLDAADALKYAAALLRGRADWTCDSIGGAMCVHEVEHGQQEGHDVELDAIEEVVSDIETLAAQFGDPRRYSDGRRIKTSREIEYGLVTSHVWHPDPSAEQPRSWTGHLPSGDPDVPSPGVFQVTTTPRTQEIFVRVVRTA